MGTVHNEENINYGKIGKFNGPSEKITNYGTIGTGNPEDNSNGRKNTADGPKTTTQRATTGGGYAVDQHGNIVLTGYHKKVDIEPGKIIIDGTTVPKNPETKDQGFDNPVFEGAYHRTATTSSIWGFRKIVNAIAVFLRNR